MFPPYFGKLGELILDYIENKRGEDVPREWREEFENGDPLDGATANDAVAIRGDDDEYEEVIKIMSPISGSSLITTFANLIHGEVNFEDREQRFRNEVELRDEVGNYLNVAEINGSLGNAIRSEWFESEPYKEWAGEASEDNFRELTSEFLSDFSDMLDEGYALKDSRLSNLLVDPKGPDYCWVDLEYGTEDADELVQKIDKIQLLESAKHIDEEKYGIFRDQFESHLGKITPEVDLASDIASLIHAYPHSVSDKIQDYTGIQLNDLNLPSQVEKLSDFHPGYEPNLDWYENALQNTDLEGYEGETWMNLFGDSVENAAAAIGSEFDEAGLDYI